MAISNYSELTQAITDTINRDDIGSFTDNFIALAEARIVRDLKTSELEFTTTMTVDEQSEALPADFAGLIRIHLGGMYPALDYLPSDTFHSTYAGQSTGRPIAFTIEANNILFAPTPDTSYTATYTYIQKPDIKTDVTNRLLTIFPDVYLFACLTEAADFVQDGEKVAYYDARYERAVSTVNSNDQFKGALSMKLSNVV